MQRVYPSQEQCRYRTGAGAGNLQAGGREKREKEKECRQAERSRKVETHK